MSFDLVGPWGWIVAGIVLVGVEVFAPGAFMMWLGIAAIITGVIAFAIPLPWEWAGLIFAALAVAAVFVGRQANRKKSESDSGEFINNRGQALVGRVFLLDGPLENGTGRVRVDDSVWHVQGADAPSGARVRVIGIEGSSLKVVPIDLG
jgi:membrane protein implicated in regulation of membrane protease activity